ncbi:MAG: magnesium transporter [Metamycoplasmataceae bacterium]
METNMTEVMLLIKEKKILKIRELISSFTITEKIDFFNELYDNSIPDAILFFRFLETDTSSEIFSYLDEDMQKEIISNLTKKEISEIINELYTDEVADIIDELPSDVSSIILSSVDVNTRKKINEILKYKENQIGSIMSVDIILLNEKETNKQALEKIKAKREQSEISQIFFVVDSKKKFLGYVHFEDIVFSNPRSLVKNNMIPASTLNTNQDKEEASIIFANEHLSVLPVVDSKGVVLGMLTYDDMIDILNIEATEDIYKNVGIMADEDEISVPYVKRSILSIIKSRLFWLVILMISSTFSQIIIEHFTELATNQFANASLSTIIVSLIPVISGVAGNSGSQSATTVTRSIALGETAKVKNSKIILKESLVGFYIGSALMVTNFLRLLIYFSITGDILKEPEQISMISFASSLALLIAVLLSKVAGSSIPLLASKFKKDPAVLSSPILTTSIDALSTLIFFSIAILFLSFII